MNLVRVRYKSYERKLPSSSNKSFPSLLLTVDVQNGVSAATDTVTNKVSAQIVDIRPKGISNAGSAANWVTLHGTASSRVTIGGRMPESTVAPPASSRPKLHHSGSNKNRRNGDCHDVELGVLNFTHLERCLRRCDPFPYCSQMSPNVIGFATGNSLHCEDMAQGGIKHGGRYCVAGEPNKVSCKNTSYTPGISMHRFPEDKSLRRLWTQFARSLHHPNTLLSVPPTFSQLASTESYL